MLRTTSLALALLALAGCATGHGQGTQSQSSSIPQGVDLHGFVMWETDMPYPASVTNPTQLTPGPDGGMPVRMRYEAGMAQRVCEHQLPQVATTQIVVSSGSGTVLGAGDLDRASLKTEPPRDVPTDDPSAFVCYLPWSWVGPTGPAFVVKYGTDAPVVVNEADAAKVINFRAPDELGGFDLPPPS
jgi:hypothetical protein